MAARKRRPPSVAIVGSGFGGLCAAIQLARSGNRSFTIFEQADSVGGTWRENVYPGAACDSPSFAYCFSFDQKTDWSRKWAPQPEILDYIRRCVSKWDLERHTRFGARVKSARWDGNRWQLLLESGERHEAQVLVLAVGQLNRPLVPEIEGLGDFGGDAFHSAEWPRGAVIDGRSVACIGNAASAVQLVPEVARRAKTLTVFQRSANWLAPKNDRTYGSLEQAVYRHVPLAARAYRSWLWLSYEIRYAVIAGKPWATQAATRMATEHLEAQVADPVLRRALVPDYTIGAKRILISDDYYPALCRENVRLVTSPIDRVTNDAVITRDGERHPADTIVLATGFRSTELLAPMEIVGADGRTLDEAWSGAPEAFLGVTVSGFPNLFILYGPNTNLGHNSIIFMLECQMRYVASCLSQMTRHGLASMEIRPEVVREYYEEILPALERTAWATVDKSWYKNATGRNTNNWPYSTFRYFLRTRRARLSDYRTRADA